ncbi:hypothetical protein [Sphingomonas cynarae]|uniref:hypothetical protein n=1 Tax=Sphingomonas cynarae TaxID=930197 RepID=UPI0031D32CD5
MPDNFQMGSFVFDDDLRLHHLPKPPARSFKVAHKGIVRAYVELRRIEASQIDRGEEFSLPQLAKAA